VASSRLLSDDVMCHLRKVLCWGWPDSWSIVFQPRIDDNFMNSQRLRWALTAGTNWDDLKQYPDSACSASSLKLRQAARELEKELKEKSGELKHCSRLDTTILLAVQQMVNYKKEDPRVQQSAISLWGSIKHLVPDQKKKAQGHKDRKVR
jgi:hypothetical protein